MVYEENREFSADLHGMVKPLVDHFIGVRLDYWQMYEGERPIKPGPFLRKIGYTQLEPGTQVILSPSGKLITQDYRSWKNGNGLTAQELRDIAAKHPGDRARKDLLRLSWFMIDPESYWQDIGGKEPSVPIPDLENRRAEFCSAEGALTEARTIRRPLIRVDGDAAATLEGYQEFLSRHLRQFWWQRGDPNGPARLVVLDSNNIDESAKPTELTGSCPVGRVPAVLATIDLSKGADLARISPVLDEAWRRYMTRRPSNADNLTFARDRIPEFKQVDATIRRLAKEGKLLAPGGRKLYRGGGAQASAR